MFDSNKVGLLKDNIYRFYNTIKDFNSIIRSKSKVSIVKSLYSNKSSLYLFNIS